MLARRQKNRGGKGVKGHDFNGGAYLAERSVVPLPASKAGETAPELTSYRRTRDTRRSQEHGAL